MTFSTRLDALPRHERPTSELSTVHALPTVVFISCYEVGASRRFSALMPRLGERLARVDGVVGIGNAHRAAASMSRTSMFYVVDGDNEVSDSFAFDFVPEVHQRSYTHVWHSKNPCIDITYGHGGVKLFPRSSVLAYSGSDLDFSTSVSAGLIVHPEVVSVEHFNESPLSAFISAFRESVKLTIINDEVSLSRLAAWKAPRPDSLNARFVKKGADMGQLFANYHCDNPSQLALINDYEFLSCVFEDRFPPTSSPL